MTYNSDIFDDFFNGGLVPLSSNHSRKSVPISPMQGEGRVWNGSDQSPDLETEMLFPATLIVQNFELNPKMHREFVVISCLFTYVLMHTAQGCFFIVSTIPIVFNLLIGPLFLARGSVFYQVHPGEAAIAGGAVSVPSMDRTLSLLARCC